MQGLRRLRKERRWKVQEVAEAIDRTPQAVYAYEKGTRFPKKTTLEALCKFFDCKVDDLL